MTADVAADRPAWRRLEGLEVVPALTVSLAGEERRIEPGGSISFGRIADLAIDDNPYMHRVVGRFVWDRGLWWIQNLGSRIVLEVADRDSASLYTVRPEAESPLHFADALVRFHAGRIAYELEVTVEEIEHIALDLPQVGGPETITIADLPMTPSQMQLVLALAEPALRDPYAREIRLPTNRQAAQRLGWTLPRFNRKLDNVCQKLTKRGVPGLHGDLSELAVDRRRRLVEYATQSGLVKPGDLALLDQPADSEP